MVALLVAFAHLLRKGNSLKLGFYFSLKLLVDVVKYSAIDAGTYLFLACFTAVMNRFITFAYGPEMLVLGTVILFVKEVQIVFDGIGEAFTPLMNIYLGEESYDGVKKCYGLSKKTAVVEGVVLTLLMILAAPFIVKLYDISDSVAYSYAVGGLRIEALGLVFLSLLYLLSSYYLLINKIKLGFVMSALRRARDLIDWEKGHKGRMQVKGDVRRTTGSETVGAAIAGNAGGNVSPKSTKPMTVTTPRVAKPSGGEDGDDEDGGGSMKNEKLDKLLFEVAQWAISVNGLSTSAVQRHFSVGYSRAGKIVDQLYGLGVCGPSKGNSKPRAMLVGMDELMQLERSGRFG